MVKKKRSRHTNPEGRNPALLLYLEAAAHCGLFLKEATQMTAFIVFIKHRDESDMHLYALLANDENLANQGAFDAFRTDYGPFHRVERKYPLSMFDQQHTVQLTRKTLELAIPLPAEVCDTGFHFLGTPQEIFEFLAPDKLIVISFALPLMNNPLGHIRKDYTAKITTLLPEHLSKAQRSQEQRRRVWRLRLLHQPASIEEWHAYRRVWRQRLGNVHDTLNSEEQIRLDIQEELDEKRQQAWIDATPFNAMILCAVDQQRTAVHESVLYSEESILCHAHAEEYELYRRLPQFARTTLSVQEYIASVGTGALQRRRK
jgi:hypothetical protein